EELHGVAERVQQPPAVAVEQRAAEMEAALGERKLRDLEAQLALARAAVPAEVGGSDGDAPERDAVVVPQLQRELRRGDVRLADDPQVDDERLAGGELLALVAFGVEQPGRDDARLAAAPL